MNRSELEQQMAQPLTLGYLSCVTLAMLDANARTSEFPDVYLESVLGNAKQLMDDVLSNQLEQYKQQLDMVRNETGDEQFAAALKEMDIPTTEEFKEMMYSIVNEHTSKFDTYREEIVKDLESKKENVDS